nr:9373_t:CDS:10 [Entrophospora candida]
MPPIRFFNFIINIINRLFRTNIRLLPPPPEQQSSDFTTPTRNVPESKLTSESRFTTTKIVSPSDADTRGFVFGGVVLGWIDQAAGTSAKKHAVFPCVTRSVDAVHFMQPIKVGDFLIIQASVNRSWNTSMEVGVRVETENPITGKRKYCCHAYLTFVALNPGDKTSLGRFRYNNSPAKVSRLVPSTTIEMARYELAETRRQSRISQSKNMDEKGRIEKTKLAELRELMREWSKNKNTEMMSDAEIPPLLPDLDNDNEAKGKDPAKLLLRRRSTLQGTLPLQPDDKLTLESFAEIVETVMPQNANTLQITFGGQIMKWMEQCSIVSASRHSRRFLLLASIDSLQFLRPTYVGDSIIVRSLVTCTFHSSLEVYVCVEAENLFTGESYFTNDGFYTMVAVDFNNSPTVIPSIIPDREQEVDIHNGAEARRKRRLQQRRELIQKEMSTHPQEFNDE